MAHRKQNKEHENLTADEEMEKLFSLFIEIGIINQLSTTAFNRRLPEGLHVSHFSVLNHMKRLGGGQTPVEIARAFQVTKGTMTHTLNELSKRGFIEIRPNPSDKRSKQVYLLKEGESFRSKAIAAMVPYQEKLLGKLDVAQVLDALPVLAHVREVLDQNRDG